MLMQFSTTWEPVKFNAQAIITSLTGATTILIQLSPAGLIPGLMLMQLSPPTMAHSLMLMQLSPTTLDHDQFSCNFQLLPTKFCNAHLMQHYNYHQIRWILTENWMRIEWELTFHFCLGRFQRALMVLWSIRHPLDVVWVLSRSVKQSNEIWSSSCSLLSLVPEDLSESPTDASTLVQMLTGYQQLQHAGLLVECLPPGKSAKSLAATLLDKLIQVIILSYLIPIN